MLYCGGLAVKTDMLTSSCWTTARRQLATYIAMCVGTMVVRHTTITTEIQKKYNQTSLWYVHKLKKKKNSVLLQINLKCDLV